MVKQLSPSLQRTLLVVHQLRVKNGYMPTPVEIADNLYYSATAIRYQVDKLTELGYLVVGPEDARGSAPRSMRFAKSLNCQGKSIPVLGVCN